MVGQTVSRLGVGRRARWLTTSCWLSVLSATVLAFSVRAEGREASDAEVDRGRRIYLEGVLPSGEPLRGQRPDTGEVEGAAAACVKCHRQSGMGSLEGGIPVPPITGRFLFATDENRPVALLDTRAPKNVTRAHASYNGESLAKAIRKGVNVAGGQMNPLMPRYALSNADIKALGAYLRQLSAEFSPGVGTDFLRFATVVAPGTDPGRREALVQMMRSAFKQRNASQQNISGRMRMPLDVIPKTLRNWELSVWELKGAPETWGAQLAENYRREPVFAVISGISSTTWAPVHAFCKKEKVPCVLPSIPLPPAAPSFYSLYFSRGVALEAEVLAKHLREQGEGAPRRLLQIYRDDEAGQGAAKVLKEALKDSGIRLEDRVLQEASPMALESALKTLSSKDGVMLWLRPADLASVGKVAPKQAPAVAYVSGILAEENYEGLPETWKPNTRVIYPYELGDKRRKNLAQLDGWLKSWSLPRVDEAFQSEVFFNLLVLTDLTSQMLDNLYRDYLVERAEDMLSWGTNSSAYPHLSLAPGQRFASKGAYIARFAPDGKLIADSEWIVP